jgi:hypothetical protein
MVTKCGFAIDRSGRQFGQGVLDRGNIEFKISHTLNRAEAGQHGRFCGGEQQLLLFLFDVAWH